MRAIAPIIAGIKDRDLRPAYMRKVSGQLGLELDEIQRAVAYAQNHPKLSRSQQAEAPAAAPRYERLNEGPQGVPGTPGYAGAPSYAGAQGAVHADAPYDPAYDAPPPEDYAAPSVYAGQNAAAHPPSSIQPAAPQLPVSSAERLPGFVTGALNALFEQQIARQKSDLMMRLEQLSANPDDEEFEAVQRQLLELEMRRRQLTAQRG